MEEEARASESAPEGEERNEGAATEASSTSGPKVVAKLAWRALCVFAVLKLAAVVWSLCMILSLMCFAMIGDGHTVASGAVNQLQECNPLLYYALITPFIPLMVVAVAISWCQAFAARTCELLPDMLCVAL